MLCNLHVKFNCKDDVLGFISKRYQRELLKFRFKSTVPRYNPKVNLKKLWKEKSWYTAARNVMPDLNRNLWLLSGKLLVTFHTNLSLMLPRPLV